MLVLRTLIFLGAIIRPIVRRHKHLFTTKFSFARQFKNHVELSLTFLDESRGKPNVELLKRKHAKSLL